MCSVTHAAAVAAAGDRYDDGGMLKITYSTAFTVSMLSWAFSQFKEGYRASGNLDFGANTIRYAALQAQSGGADVLRLIINVA
jgi:hypothetical protein